MTFGPQRLLALQPRYSFLRTHRLTDNKANAEIRLETCAATG